MKRSISEERTNEEGEIWRNENPSVKIYLTKIEENQEDKARRMDLSVE